MNKGELIDQVAADANLTKKDAGAAINAVLEVIMRAVEAGDKVTLVGFGTFEPRERQEREGRNPSTGKPIKIPATTAAAFTAGKDFKDRVASAKPKAKAA